jgi:hypothetical protein
VTLALRDLGAARLGKALVALSDSATLAHLADHRTPIEVAGTELVNEAVARLGVVAGGHWLRMFVDRGLCVAVCSVERSFGGRGYSAIFFFFFFFFFFCIFSVFSPWYSRQNHYLFILFYTSAGPRRFLARLRSSWAAAP